MQPSVPSAVRRQGRWIAVPEAGSPRQWRGRLRNDDVRRRVAL